MKKYCCTFSFVRCIMSVYFYTGYTYPYCSILPGMDYPTSSTTIEAVKDSLVVSICNEIEKQSSKRKRDDLKASIDSGYVDDKKTKVNKIKNRGKVEKHASCRGVYLSDNKSRSKRKHKVEYMSGMFTNQASI